jgi:hypothetical protein
MSNINVIIISKVGPSNTEWTNTVKGYDLATSSPSNTTIIYPTSNLPETTALIDSGALNLTNNTWYNLIIYEWANCVLPSNSDIQDVIGSITSTTQPWDTAYLGKWMDTCNKYSTFEDSEPQNQFNLVIGSEPVGFHAVLLNNNMSTKLNTALTDGKVMYYSINYALLDIGINDTSIKYIAVSPNLFTYDPLYNVVDESQVYAVKSNECVGTTSEVNPPSDNDLTFFWIFLLVIGVSLIVLFVITTNKESYKYIGSKSGNEL